MLLLKYDLNYYCFIQSLYYIYFLYRMTEPICVDTGIEDETAIILAACRRCGITTGAPIAAWETTGAALDVVKIDLTGRMEKRGTTVGKTTGVARDGTIALEIGEITGIILPVTPTFKTTKATIFTPVISSGGRQP